MTAPDLAILVSLASLGLSVANLLWLRRRIGKLKADAAEARASLARWQSDAKYARGQCEGRLQVLSRRVDDLERQGGGRR